MIDFNIWRFNQLGFHLTNVLFHDVNSLEEVFDARVIENSIHLSLPASLRFHEVHDHGLEVMREGNRLVVNDLNATLPKNTSLVGFQGGHERPMFRAIVWNAEAGGAAGPPPAAAHDTLDLIIE